MVPNFFFFCPGFRLLVLHPKDDSPGVPRLVVKNTSLEYIICFIFIHFTIFFPSSRLKAWMIIPRSKVLGEKRNYYSTKPATTVVSIVLSYRCSGNCCSEGAHRTNSR